MALVAAKVPPPSDAMSDRALDAAMKHVAAQGVTSVHHMGTWDELGVFERARRAGRLATRIYAAVPLGTWARLRDAVAAKRFGPTDAATPGCASARSRGSSTARSARTPRRSTSRSPTRRGSRAASSRTPEDLYAWISGADEAGLHVVVHAIGDRANATLLDIFERVGSENGARDRRFRIEHAQHLAPADIPRFGALGVIASMQPYHAIDDGRWAETVIGPERIKDDVCVPLAARRGRAAGVRQRLVRRAADAARGDLRRGHAPHARRRESRTAGCRSRRSRSRKRCAPTRRRGATRRSRSARRARSRRACSPT